MPNIFVRQAAYQALMERGVGRLLPYGQAATRRTDRRREYEDRRATYILGNGKPGATMRARLDDFYARREHGILIRAQWAERFIFHAVDRVIF